MLTIFKVWRSIKVIRGQLRVMRGHMIKNSKMLSHMISWVAQLFLTCIIHMFQIAKFWGHQRSKQVSLSSVIWPFTCLEIFSFNTAVFSFHLICNIKGGLELKKVLPVCWHPFHRFALLIQTFSHLEVFFIFNEFKNIVLKKKKTNFGVSCMSHGHHLHILFICNERKYLRKLECCLFWGGLIHHFDYRGTSKSHFFISSIFILSHEPSVPN